MIPNKHRLTQLLQQRSRNRFSHYFCVYVADFGHVIVCLVTDFFT